MHSVSNFLIENAYIIPFHPKETVYFVIVDTTSIYAYSK